MKTFDEKYIYIIQEMKKHLEKTGLTMIEFIDDDFYKFHLGKVGKSTQAKMKREQKKYDESHKFTRRKSND